MEKADNIFFEWVGTRPISADPVTGDFATTITVVVCFGRWVVASGKDGFPTDVVEVVPVDDPIREVGRGASSSDNRFLRIVGSIIDREAEAKFACLEVDFFAGNQVTKLVSCIAKSVVQFGKLVQRKVGDIKSSAISVVEWN